jgi:hypothetical protein
MQPDRPLTLPERREIFRALIETQHAGRPAAEVAERFGVSEERLYYLELEGASCCWPPLD